MADLKKAKVAHGITSVSMEPKDSYDVGCCGLAKYMKKYFSCVQKTSIGYAKMDTTSIFVDATITRSALGGSASLGDLYDARTDTFCGAGVFKKAIPASARTLIDAPFAQYELVYSDLYSDKFSKMDVSAEIKVSVLGGLFSLSASGKYLNDRKQTSRELNMSVVYNVRTKDESVNIFHEDLKDVFSVDALKSNMATHIVVGIWWGANSALTCAYENKANRDTKEIEGKLGANVQLFGTSISGTGHVKFDEGDIETGEKFQIRMYCDVLPEKDKLPTTFETALDFVRALPSMIGKYNEGKGKPIAYRLLPISILLDYLSLKIDIDTTFKSLQESAITQVVQLFDEMTTAQQQVETYYSDVQKYGFSVLAKDREDIQAFRKRFMKFGNDIKGQLSSVLCDIRSGKTDATKINQIIETFYSDKKFSPTKISEKLKSWGESYKKTGFAKVLTDHQVLYLKADEILRNKLLELVGKWVYVLFFNAKAQDGDSKIWIINTELFIKEATKQSKDTVCYAVDCDIHPELQIAGMDVCVRLYKDGICYTDNVFGQLPVFDIFDIKPDTTMWLSNSLVVSQTSIPRYAVCAGLDPSGNPNFVCRGNVGDGLKPGSLHIFKNSQEARFPFHGQKVVNTYEVLISPPWAVSWVKISGSTVPKNAIPGGQEVGCPLYIGRVQIKNGMICGKVWNSDKKWHGIYVCNDKKEIKFDSNFEVLVKNEFGASYRD